jgi:hypothetical protein
MTLRKLRNNPLDISVPQSIRNPFKQALHGNTEIVDRFLARHIVTRDDIQLTHPQQTAWEIEHSLEAIQLSQHLLQAASGLNTKGETLNSAFLVVERALEAIHCAVFTAATPSLPRIQRMLTREPMDK